MPAMPPKGFSAMAPKRSAATHPPVLNTAENRAELVRAAHAAGCMQMTTTLAGGLLMYSAMPPGEEKDRVKDLAHRLDATYPELGGHPGVCLGAAFLVTVSLPESRFWTTPLDVSQPS